MTSFFDARNKRQNLDQVLLTSNCVAQWNKWLRAEEALLSDAADIVSPYIKLTVEQFEARSLAKALKFSYSIEWTPPEGDESVVTFGRGDKADTHGWLLASPDSVEVLKPLGPWVLGFNENTKKLFVYPFKEKSILLKAVKPFQVK